MPSFLNNTADTYKNYFIFYRWIYSLTTFFNLIF